MGWPLGWTSRGSSLVVLPADGPAWDVVGLCSGGGAAELSVMGALHCRGIPGRVRLLAEKEDDERALLKLRYHDATVVGDISCATEDFASVGNPTILCAGIPCQPHSQAGNNRAPAWTHPAYVVMGYVIAAIAQMRPKGILIEEVDDFAANPWGASVFLSWLDRLGYDATWQVVTARACGAWHERARWYCIAVRRDSGSITVPCGPLHPPPPRFDPALWAALPVRRAVKAESGSPEYRDAQFRESIIGNGVVSAPVEGMAHRLIDALLVGGIGRPRFGRVDLPSMCVGNAVRGMVATSDANLIQENAKWRADMGWTPPQPQPVCATDSGVSSIGCSETPAKGDSEMGPSRVGLEDAVETPPQAPTGEPV